MKISVETHPGGSPSATGIYILDRKRGTSVLDETSKHFVVNEASGLNQN